MNLLMERWIVHWEMGTLLILESLVLSHVMMALCYVVVTLGHVGMIDPGVVVRLHV